MDYRITKEELLDELSGWNTFLKRKVHLIACGGTALTLLNIEPSTKDIDLMIPDESEYVYLVRILADLGYHKVQGSGWSRGGKFIYDLFCGSKIHTTEIIESPLENDNNIPYEEYAYIYLGILNYYDLIISKIFRGTYMDFEDCTMLINAKSNEIDLEILRGRFIKTAAYDVSEIDVIKKMEKFLESINRI